KCGGVFWQSQCFCYGVFCQIIEDHTKQNKRRQSSWDPNSVGLGLGYFERAKLSHKWSKENVKTWMAQSRTREGKRKEEVKTGTTRSRTREDSVPGTPILKALNGGDTKRNGDGIK
ncbi:hypothetical protein T09_3098, partial [Trichinella sp. T9]